MGLEVSHEGRHARAILRGELTIYTVSEIKATLASALERADEIEIDLSGITEADTAGLQLMLIAKCYPGKTVRFVNHPVSVLRLIDLACLGQALGDPLFLSAVRY